MRIAILDNDRIFCEALKDKLSQYGAEIYTFNNAHVFCLSELRFDIAFIEIEVKGTGFQAARYAKIRNPDCIIAIITNHAEFMTEGYRYRIFRYILKTEPKSLINKEINDVFNEYYKINKFINGTYKGEDFTIRIRDISYIEITGRIANIHTTKGIYKMYSQISALENELSRIGFIRCHRSFIVNSEFIRSIKNDSEFELFTKEVIPISRGYKTQTKAAYAYFSKI